MIIWFKKWRQEVERRQIEERILIARDGYPESYIKLFE